jgi:hypothetical protein
METKECEHCWHIHRGPLSMVLPAGSVALGCCRCPRTKVVHEDHAGGSAPVLTAAQWALCLNLARGYIQ